MHTTIIDDSINTVVPAVLRPLDIDAEWKHVISSAVDGVAKVKCSIILLGIVGVVVYLGGGGGMLAYLIVNDLWVEWQRYAILAGWYTICTIMMLLTHGAASCRSLN